MDVILLLVNQNNVKVKNIFVINVEFHFNIKIHKNILQVIILLEVNVEYFMIIIGMMKINYLKMILLVLNVNQ